VVPGHVPLLVSLRIGIVTYRQGTESKRCAIGRGFAEAGPNKLVILTDDFIERPQIDPVVVRKELAEVQGQILKLEGVPQVAPGVEAAEGATQAAEAFEQMQSLIVRENWLAAQLELYGDPPAATARPFEAFGPPPPPPDDEVPQSEGGGT
jgi:F-type H+-transporting ATPase subunit epsilon